MNAVVTFALLCLTLTQAGAEYRYYYRNSRYDNSLSDKVGRLEETIKSLQSPVHLHVHGDDEDHAAHSNLKGTHIHMHLSIDGSEQGALAMDANEWTYASCYVQPNQATGSMHSVTGFVHLRQKPSSELEVKLNLRGFRRAGAYGFHIHQVADFSNGCNSFGGHFNPFRKTHGSPADEERHVGDFGNINADSEGRVRLTFTDRLATMFGRHSIIGRGFVIHAGEDDLGKGGNPESLKTGNAGKRLACCAIGRTNGEDW